MAEPWYFWVLTIGGIIAFCLAVMVPGQWGKYGPAVPGAKEIGADGKETGNIYATGGGKRRKRRKK